MPGTANQHETHWKDLAASYDAIMGKVPQMHDLFAEIVKHLPTSVETVLDLGAGTGNLLKEVSTARPDAKLYALDPAESMLDLLQIKFAGETKVTSLIGSAHAIELPDDSMDVIVSNYALHHLTHAEKKICAKEVIRVLRPGGKFIYGDQHCWTMGGPENHEWVADMFSLLSEKAMYYLQTAGLDRMLLQVELMPKFLRAEGEMPVPVDYWLECLDEAGFPPATVVRMEPVKLLNCVIVAVKPR
jgi:ubiquinone/menaquinone biosynthesis C-methylase UbiE